LEGNIKLLSFQDIKNELDQKEIESYQKLISVLTHEIVNSVSPVTSLAASMATHYKEVKEIFENKLNSREKEWINESIQGLLTIENRGNKLIDFIQKYRMLSKLPSPIKENMLAEDLFSSIKLLFSPILKQKNIKLIYKMESKDFSVFADSKLIEQAMINLVKNAIESFDHESNAQIELFAGMNANQKKFISVQNNGKPISPEIAEKLFIPFFTNKANGSGIGLSLARQIMTAHEGTISLNSTYEKGTVFILEF